LTIAMAAWARALATSNAADLGERVDHAATLLKEAGNAYHFADVYFVAGHRALNAGSDRQALEFYRRATPLVRELGSPYEWMLLRGNFGTAALLSGDTETARHAFREQLQLCRKLGVLPSAAAGLRGHAAVAATRDDLDPRRAALGRRNGTSLRQAR
jgi:tetratricopeptide (TPR) repeat protein